MLAVTDDEKSMILGKLIQDERRRQRKSAEVVASLAGISQQYLSEIERGKKSLPLSSIRSVLETLGLSFDDNTGLIARADRLLDAVIDAYMNFDRDGMRSYIEELLSTQYHYSYAYPYYIAVIFAQKCLLKKETGIPFPQIKINSAKVNMFLCLCMEKTVQDSRDTQAASLIQKGLSLYTPYGDQPSCAALYGALLYDLAGIQEQANRLFDALNLNRQALDIVTKFYYFSFALSIELNLAVLYGKMGQTQLSIRQNLRVLHLADKHAHAVLHNAARFNLASNYLVSGQYEQCISTSLELLPLIQDNPAYAELYYLLACSHYMLGDPANAEKYCALLLAGNCPARFSHKFAQALLEGLSAGFDIPNLKRLFQETINIGDQSDVEMVFRLLTEQLKKERLFQDATECYEVYTGYRFARDSAALPDCGGIEALF